MDILEVPFGFIKAGKVYQSGWGEFPDREIGEVRDDNNEKSVEFFNDRFADLEQKIKE